MLGFVGDEGVKGKHANLMLVSRELHHLRVVELAVAAGAAVAVVVGVVVVALDRPDTVPDNDAAVVGDVPFPRVDSALVVVVDRMGVDSVVVRTADGGSRVQLVDSPEMFP